ncbi:MAG TPA: acylneuraminate cytidylyltransferase family protein [Anaerolineales bacterium]|nr:acylneuraminate cytidylyltransferase family protein [Anaerolineales bacterium]
MKIAALVPMRHHSQRVPGKNYRPLAGQPLFYYILQTLQAVPEIDQVIVDTDSEPVMRGIRADFPAVRIIDRPEHLRPDDVSMNDVLLHDTGQVQADLYLQTHSTNPLLLSDTVSRAIRALLAPGPAHDSLFSVTRLQTRLYDADGRAINHDPAILIQTQDLPPVYQENSCLYIFDRENLVQYHHRIGKSPLMFEIDAEEAWDIDNELDFAICDFLISRSHSSARNR